MDLIVKPSRAHDAAVEIPGDKSISHRALILGSVAEGRTEIRNFLFSDDCLATRAAFESMGVAIRSDARDRIIIDGVGLHGLQAPAAALDLGNSGTAMRLLAGLLAGQAFDTELTGDASLRGRPMARVVTPLTQMGAVIETDCDGSPPLQVRGGLRLSGIDYALPVASAQVKSAILLAGLYASGSVRVTEPAVTRDHTERMLRAMGVDVVTDGRSVFLQGGQVPKGCTIDVPADLSSAMFIIVAALIADKAEIRIEGVGVNPTRTGAIDILRSMGARIELHDERMAGGEPVADIVARSSTLRAVDVPASLVSLAIDEFPALFVAAACAEGTTRFEGIGELRVKESDRIGAMATGLQSLGVEVEETETGAAVRGGPLSGGDVASCGDHRVAMSFAVAGSVASGPVRVGDAGPVQTSFPGFADCLRAIGLDVSAEP